MKKLTMILTMTVLLGLTACGSLSPVNVRVIPDKLEHTKPLTRSGKFLGCLTRLNNEGFKQSLILDLCSATYGSID